MHKNKKAQINEKMFVFFTSSLSDIAESVEHNHRVMAEILGAVSNHQKLLLYEIEDWVLELSIRPSAEKSYYPIQQAGG